MEAISASDRTVRNMPTLTPRNTHIAPAVPPSVNEKAVILVGFLQRHSDLNRNLSMVLSNFDLSLVPHRSGELDTDGSIFKERYGLHHVKSRMGQTRRLTARALRYLT